MPRTRDLDHYVPLLERASAVLDPSERPPDELEREFGEQERAAIERGAPVEQLDEFAAREPELRRRQR